MQAVSLIVLLVKQLLDLKMFFKAHFCPWTITCSKSCFGTSERMEVLSHRPPFDFHHPEDLSYVPVRPSAGNIPSGWLWHGSWFDFNFIKENVPRIWTILAPLRHLRMEKKKILKNYKYYPHKNSAKIPSSNGHIMNSSIAQKMDSKVSKENIAIETLKGQWQRNFSTKFCLVHKKRLPPISVKTPVSYKQHIWKLLKKMSALDTAIKAINEFSKKRC